MDSYAIKKIYFFDFNSSLYNVLHYFTLDLMQAFSRQKVETKLIKANLESPKEFANLIYNDPPDLTLTFNGLMPDNEGRFLCDLIKIPHLAYLVDSPHGFMPLIRSKYNILSFTDEDFCDYMKGYRFPNVLFLPHGVNASVAPLAKPEWKYDVVMLNTFIDHVALQNSWKDKYGIEVTHALNETAEKVLNQSERPYLKAFAETMDNHIRRGIAINPKALDMINILSDLENYLDGRSQFELLNAIDDVQVDIFGQYENTNWKTYLAKNRNIRVHEPVQFPEALEIMKRSKIILNTTPKFKRGLHERILNAMACGSVVLAFETPFLREWFDDEREILFYSSKNLSGINQKLHLYLEDEGKRYDVARKGREKVMKYHTWDERAKTILEELPPILERM